jgi:hypothetical protein
MARGRASPGIVVNDKADLNRGEAYTAAGEPLPYDDPA